MTEPYKNISGEVQGADRIHTVPSAQIWSLRGWADQHALEIVGISVPTVAALCYAIGHSYGDGWNQVAAIPSLVFKTDVYDTMLAGINLVPFWRVAAGTVAVAGAYLWLNVFVSNCWDRRFGGLRARKRRYESCDELGLRKRSAGELRSVRKTGKFESQELYAATARWRLLGKRGTARLSQEALAVARRKRRSPNRTAYKALVSAFLFAFVVGLYSIFQTMLTQARIDGARAYVSLYVAVTGSIPPQYELDSETLGHMQTYACEGRAELAKYRVVKLKSDTDDQSSESFYVLQGDGNTYFLLGVHGSTIRSFGDAQFLLTETSERPVATLAKGCS